MNYRYEKIGKHDFLKVPCDPLVSNNLVNGVIVERPEETPLEILEMNFTGQGDVAKSEADNSSNEPPLTLPRMEF